MDCRQCGESNPPRARFCSACGNALQQQAGDAERKQVTVLFSDLSGYTTLSEKLDPEEAREIIAAIFARAAEIVSRYGGQIEKFVGDAIMAIFGVAEAHEDDPARAIRAALELHEAVTARAPDLKRKVGVMLAMHSGINTGVVVTGELRFDHGTAGPLGDTINTAARLMELAPAGEIFIGPETRRSVEAVFDVDDIGEQSLKGKARPFPVARVVGRTAGHDGPRRRRGDFVGRQEEIGVLLDAVGGLIDGKGGAVAICGDAGTGKTRLFEELRDRVGGKVRWIEGRAYPYTENIPFFMFSDLLNWNWQIHESDDPVTLRNKVAQGVARLSAHPEKDLPVIAKLYGLKIESTEFIDREAYQERLLDTIGRFLATLAEEGPTVVCLQDLHFADASSLRLIRRLLAAPPTPVLFLCNYRPGPELDDMAREITLRDFSSRQTRQLVVSLLAEHAPPDNLLRLVEAQAEGNPFFIEELINALVENGELVQKDTGWTLQRGSDAIRVPSTIRGLIAARIDGLDDDSRRVLRRAAVLGREFIPDVLDRVLEGEPNLGRCLGKLVDADLLRIKRRQPELLYGFKHALTQEVAYVGLLRTERVELHGRAAVATESLLADRIPEFVETLALHFMRGGITDRAVHYLVEAGKKATSRYALDEATAHFQQAYQLLADRPRTASEDHALVELLLEWMLVLHYQNRLEEILSRLQEYEAVAEGIGDQDLKGMFAAWLGEALWFSGDLIGAVEKLEQAERIGRSAGSGRVIAYANAWKSYPLWFLGREAEALDAAETVIPLATRFPDDHYLFFIGQAGAAGAAAARGELSRVRRIGESLVAFAKRTGNARAAVAGYCCISSSFVMQASFEEAVDAARKAKSRAIDPFYLAWAIYYEALALAWAGRSGEGRKAVDELLCQGTRFWTSLARPLEALILLGEGHLSAGLAQLLHDLEHFHQTGALFMEHFCRSVLGSLYTDIACGAMSWDPVAMLRNPGFVLRTAFRAPVRARSWLDKHLEMLEEDEVSVQLGPAHVDLARLDHHEGNDAGAREHLTRACEIFQTQGADTALSTTRALAEEWNLAT